MVNVGLNTILKHCRAAIVWNFMLDMNRGPNLDGGCQTCFGAIDIDNDYKSYTLNSHYYTICQMSAVVRPGAVRINTTGWWYDGVTYAAFRNPDGTLALVLYNSTNKELNINVADGVNRYPLYVPTRAVVSLLMNTDQTNNVGQVSFNDASDTYYSLRGFKVDTPLQPGIYIHQGKKEIIQ